MEKISKEPRKISVVDLLGLDANDPEDQNFIRFKDILVGLGAVMTEKGVSMNELARRMNISRQAVYEKFSGKNTSMKWILRACDALKVDICVAFVDREGKRVA